MRSQISTVLQTLACESGRQLMDDKDIYFANGLPECFLAIASLILLFHIIIMLQITNEEMRKVLFPPLFASIQSTPLTVVSVS